MSDQKPDKNAPIKITEYGADGMTERPATQKDVEWLARVRIREMQDAGELPGGSDTPSPAREWLKRYNAKYTQFIFPTLEGEGEGGPFFVKSLSDAEIIEVGVLMAREGYSMDDIEDLEARHLLYIALLTVGVCVGTDDPTRFFDSVQEAREFYEAPGNAAFISGHLRGAIVALNPTFQSKKNAEEMEEATKNTNES